MALYMAAAARVPGLCVQTANDLGNVLASHTGIAADFALGRKGEGKRHLLSGGRGKRGDVFFLIFARRSYGIQVWLAKDIPKGSFGGLDDKPAPRPLGMYPPSSRRVVRVSTPAAAEMTKLLEKHLTLASHCSRELSSNSSACGWYRQSWDVMMQPPPKPLWIHPFLSGQGWVTCIRWTPSIFPGRPKGIRLSTKFIELAEKLSGHGRHVLLRRQALNSRRKL